MNNNQKMIEGETRDQARGRKAVRVMKGKTGILIMVVAALCWCWAGLAQAQPANASQANQGSEVSGPVPWISAINGPDNSLQVRQPDSDWFEATVNTPLGEGDQVWQDAGGRSEIYIDRGTYLRLDEGSGARFDSLKDNEIALVLTKGTAEVSNGTDSPMYVDLPGQTVILDRGAMARVSVNDNGQSEVVTKRGRVRAHGPAGDVRIEAGQTMVADANGKVLRLNRGLQQGRFDRWSSDRDQDLNSVAPAPSGEMAYAPEPVVRDFARNGAWINDPEYGYVWRPYVDSGWAPYREGRWVYRPAWGWTWVSYEPWGWYPYHYGRWLYVGSYWCWSPVYVHHHHWSPALVYWIDGPDYVAWHPWPYGVVYGVYLGPDYYHSHYFYGHGVTLVYHRDFHHGHYDRYRHDWNDDFRRRGEYSHGPRRFDTRDLREHRTPRENGYTARARVPQDDRIYARRRVTESNERGGRIERNERVSYGSADRSQLRQRDAERGREARSGDRNNDRGNREATRGDRPDNRNRETRAADRPGRENNRETRATDRPGRETGREGRTEAGNRETRPGRTLEGRPSSEARGYRGDTNRAENNNRGDRPDAATRDNNRDTNRGDRPDAATRDTNRDTNRGDRPDAATRDTNRDNNRGDRPQPADRPDTSNRADSNRGSDRPSYSGGESRPQPDARPSRDSGRSDSGSRPAPSRSPSRGSRPRASADQPDQATRPQPTQSVSRPRAATPSRGRQAAPAEAATAERTPAYRETRSSGSVNTYRENTPARDRAPARDNTPSYRESSAPSAPSYSAPRVRESNARASGGSESRGSGGSHTPSYSSGGGSHSSPASSGSSRSSSGSSRSSSSRSSGGGSRSHRK